eukprot:8590891-Pyramimonas_sp.AAC.1
MPLTEYLVAFKLIHTHDPEAAIKRPRRHQLRVSVRRGRWEQLDLACLDMHSTEEKEIRPASKKHKKKKPYKKYKGPDGASHALEPLRDEEGEEDAEEDDADDDLDVEGWLELLLEGCDEEPAPEEDEDAAAVEEAEDKPLDEDGIDDEGEDEEPREPDTHVQSIPSLQQEEETRLRDKVKAGSARVKEAKARADAQSEGTRPLAPGVISLVSLAGAAAFVRWQADKGMMRQLLLDNKNRLKYVVGGEACPLMNSE